MLLGLLFSILVYGADDLVAEYQKVHRQFVRQLCPANTEREFLQLLGDFQGGVFFVPSLGNKKLDQETVQSLLPELQNKKKWIEQQIIFLNKEKNFLPAQKTIQEINSLLQKLVQFKKDDFENGQSQKNQTPQLLKELRQKFAVLIQQIPFLLSYHFPVDHMVLRREYDLNRQSVQESEQKEGNYAYLYRKIVEDGAQNPGKSGENDFPFRAVLDTLHFSLQKDYDFIPEDLRYDLSWAMRQLKQYLKHGVAWHLRRMKEWPERTAKLINFYQDLMLDRIVDGRSLLTSMVEMRSQKRLQLEQYILNKQKQTYLFWASRSENLQALFVLDTILVNEAGRGDILDRQDVAKVVVLRRSMPTYTSAPSSYDPYDLLTSAEIKSQATPWLNLLFKKGEFSFTYFFLPATVRVFCPSTTAAARKLQRKNLALAQEALKSTKDNWPATRYFSRISMLGRMNMGLLWTDYTPLPERPGPEIKVAKAVIRAYQKKNYLFWYGFKDAAHKWYQVIEINGKKFVVLKDSLRFFTYRNQHLFRFFSPKKINQ